MRSDGWLDWVSIAGLVVALLAAVLVLILVHKSSLRERDQQSHIQQLVEREALLRYAVDHLEELSDQDLERLGIRHRADPLR